MMFPIIISCKIVGMVSLVTSNVSPTFHLKDLQDWKNCFSAFFILIELISAMYFSELSVSRTAKPIVTKIKAKPTEPTVRTEPMRYHGTEEYKRMSE